MDKTALIHKELIDVIPVNIYLKKTGLYLTALYKGSQLVGIINDFTAITEDKLPTLLTDLVPKNINNLDQYKSNFEDRVEYHDDIEEEDYHFISTADYYKSKILIP